MPVLFLLLQIEDVEKEVQKRGLSIAQLRRLEPDSTGGEIVNSDEEEEEDEESEDASEGDNDVFLGDYRKDPAGNYRHENYRNDDNREAADGEAEDGDGDEPGDYRRA